MLFDDLDYDYLPKKSIYYSLHYKYFLTWTFVNVDFHLLYYYSKNF